jgi:hypothetical protein
LSVFEPTVCEGFQWVQPVNTADFELFRSLDGHRLGTDWNLVPVRLLDLDEDGRPLEKADMPWLDGHALVLTERAVAVLGDLLAQDAELLPLSCDVEELWLVNVVRMVDGLDLEQ